MVRWGRKWGGDWKRVVRAWVKPRRLGFEHIAFMYSALILACTVSMCVYIFN